MSACCNRCRRKLTREASIIKGIGPVCEKRGLKSLGLRASETLEEKHRNELFMAYDGINDALRREFGEGLDYDAEHRMVLERLVCLGANRVLLLERTYAIVADVCNQLPAMIDVANAVQHFFFVVGAPEEGEAAHKRLCKIAQKVGTF